MDEDFFDQLVDDDDNIRSPAEEVLEGCSDAVHSEDATGECVGSFHPVRNDNIIDGKLSEDVTSGIAGSFHSLGKDDDDDDDDDDDGDLLGLEGDVVDLNYHKDESVRSEVPQGSNVSNSDETASPGIKEVGWNSFYADSTENGGLGFGSYSDFFNDITDVSNGKTEESVKADELGQNAASYEQHSDGAQSSEPSNGNNGNPQDTSSIEYWESLYPGWKYDATTGQWYQENNYNGSLQGSTEGSVGNLGEVSDRRAEVSYLQQNVHSAAGTLSAEENSTTEAVFGWEQVSQMNDGYPEHMYFDPQYPGWYYDTIAQEWRTLESYNSSVQSSNQSIQAHDQQSRDRIASSGGYSNSNSSTVGESGKMNNYSSEGFKSKDNHNWAAAYGDYDNQGSSLSQSWGFAKTNAGSGPPGNQQLDYSYLSSVSMQNHMHQQKSSSNSLQQVPLHDKTNHVHHNADGFTGFRTFIPSENVNQQLQQGKLNQTDHAQFTSNLYSHERPSDVVQSPFQNSQQVSYASHIGRSSAGRPPHALVTFGFGGKLVVMKGTDTIQNPSFSGQALVGSNISVLNLLEVVTGSTNGSTAPGMHDYFCALSQQYFPGPLVGGNVGNKELSRWIDDKITYLESPDADYRKGEVLRLLLSLLKISCQHYGKLRSPYGTENALKENDSPESAVAQLFASTKKKGLHYGAIGHCLQPFPSEGQIRATASEVQNLLVSGRKKEALQCALDGRLWGPALVLASQLGEQFYIDSVKQMALRQLVVGSPLRTLCLLIAGQPAEVFSMGTSDTGSISQQPAQIGVNCMLDDWEENLAVITANRTKDDELVIIHLGDCLWRERSQIIPAHICYLIAEANFEAYSDSARLCLIGADHWKFPRTYASPEAIQRTELYEYSKVLGNSQFILLPIQPYKIIYAHMLAEVGRMSDSLKYCQAVLKSLKTTRVPEVESWKQSISSLEERIRTHQQGGYAANLAPSKYFGKLLNFFDSTAHHLVGAVPPPAPSSHGDALGSEHYQQTAGPRVSASQSTMAISTLMPYASMEPVSNWEADANKMKMHNRSVSEPDFGRTPRQVDSKTEASTATHEKSYGGGSRFSRFSFGSQLLQKTVGLVLRSRPDKQAKLGETNKFYYDEKLKRWVEEGAEPPAEETALPPPPTSASFQDGKPDYNLKSPSNSASLPNGGGAEFKLSSPSDHASGVPPIPTSSNQFSARGHMGVRARYVDTFNKGGGSQVNFFQSPAAKPITAANTKFFIPTPASTAEQNTGPNSGSLQENIATENQSSSIIRGTSEPHETFQSPPHSSSMTMQRFPSMGDIAKGAASMPSNNHAAAHARRASWSGGSFNNALPPTMGERKSLGEALGMPSSSFMSPHPNSTGSLVDELLEVAL